jgi:hypothetical protein
MSTIIDIQAREILDSRGNPTVEVDVHLAGGAMAGPLFPAAPARANTKPSNSATVTKNVISARASPRPSRTSSIKSPRSSSARTRSTSSPLIVR